MSAAAFSVNAVLIRRGVVQATPLQALFVTVLLGVPMFLVVSLATGQLLRAPDMPAESYGYLAAGGIVNFIAGRYLNYLAIEAIGAARSAPFQAMTLPYSVLIAFLFLGESVTAGIGAGVTLIMVGPLIMLERRSRQPATVTGSPAGAGTDGAPAFQPRLLRGYTAAVLASAGYGTSPILFRAAIEDRTGFSILAALVAYAAAGAVLLTLALLGGRRDLLRSMDLRMLRIFFGASVSVVAAQTLRFLALSLAPVAIVTGLERTNSVFTLVLSYYTNRTLELITLRVVLGILVSLAGALTLVVALER